MKLVKVIVSIILTAMVGFLFAITMYYLSKNALGNDHMHALSDGFFIPGILLVCFWGLLMVSQEGSFDILAYSIKKVIQVTFKGYSDLPRSYTDYKAMKHDKENHLFINLLVVGAVFVIVSGIITFI